MHTFLFLRQTLNYVHLLQTLCNVIQLRFCMLGWLKSIEWVSFQNIIRTFIAQTFHQPAWQWAALVIFVIEQRVWLTFHIIELLTVKFYQTGEEQTTVYTHQAHRFYQQICLSHSPWKSNSFNFFKVKLLMLNIVSCNFLMLRWLATTKSYNLILSYFDGIFIKEHQRNLFISSESE